MKPIRRVTAIKSQQTSKIPIGFGVKLILQGSPAEKAAIMKRILPKIHITRHKLTPNQITKYKLTPNQTRKPVYALSINIKNIKTKSPVHIYKRKAQRIFLNRQAPK